MNNGQPESELEYELDYPENVYVRTAWASKRLPAEHEREISMLLKGTPDERSRAREQLITHNITSVIGIASNYATWFDIQDELEDLTSEATIALIEATDKYSPYGKSYHDFIVQAINWACKHYLANRGLIRISQHVSTRIPLLQEISDEAIKKTGQAIGYDTLIDHATQTISEKIGKAIHNVLLCYEFSQHPQNGLSPETSTEDTPLDHAITQETLNQAHCALQTLAQQEQIILRQRIMHDKTLKETANTVKLSRERVRQLEISALNTVRRTWSTEITDHDFNTSETGQ